VGGQVLTSAICFFISKAKRHPSGVYTESGSIGLNRPQSGVYAAGVYAESDTTGLERGQRRFSEAMGRLDLLYCHPYQRELSTERLRQKAAKKIAAMTVKERFRHGKTSFLT